MWELRRVDEVLSRALPLIEPPGGLRVSVTGALGMYLYEDVESPLELPPRPKSTVDGFAVDHLDCAGASQSSPRVLRLRRGTVPPGSAPPPLGRGEAVRVETGTYLPDGADAVVPVEEAEVEGDRVIVYRSPARYENVSLPGEELSRGPLARRGERLRPWHLAALRACGIDEVAVYDLGATILATGDEFASGGAVPFTVELVRGWLAEHGVRVLGVDTLPDDRSLIAARLREALSSSWLVVATGGTSMGSKDYTVRAIGDLGPSYMAHGLALRPGKTTCLSVVGGRVVLAVSGLPVAALSALESVLRPLLRRMGLKIPERPRARVRLARRVSVKLGLRGFVRLRLFENKGVLYGEPLMVGGSGSLNSLLRADAFLTVPEDVEGYDEGEEVEVELVG